MANKKGHASSEELDGFDPPQPRVRAHDEEEELLPEDLGEDDEPLAEPTVSLAPVSPEQADPVADAPEPNTPLVFDTEQSCTTVGPTVVVRGKIRSDENLVVFGRIEAGLRSSKDVRLEVTGIINADLQVRCIWVAGIVVGDIHATQLVELSPEARVIGDIYTARLIVKDGAKFRGRVEMEGLSALEAIKPVVQSVVTPVAGKKGKPAPPVAEVIWSDVEDLAPTPAHRQAAVAPDPSHVDKAAARAPAQIAVTQRVRQPTAPTAPPKAPEKPATPAAQPAQAAQAQPPDKGQAEGEKGIGSWFRRQ